MIPESRDDNGKLKVGYFIELGMDFKTKHGHYESNGFKSFVEKLGVLLPEDWLPDGEHKHTWKHRVDRATQKILTGI